MRTNSNLEYVFARRDISLLLVLVAFVSVVFTPFASYSLPAVAATSYLADKTRATETTMLDPTNKPILEQNKTKVKALSEAVKLTVKQSLFWNLGESIPYFDKALTINPNFTFALIGKGISLLNLQQYNQSIPYFDKALTINPDSFTALFAKGAYLLRLRQYNESIPYFDKALTINPNSSYVLYGAASFIPGGLVVTEISFIKFLSDNGFTIATATAIIILIRLSSVFWLDLIGAIATYFASKLGKQKCLQSNKRL